MKLPKLNAAIWFLAALAGPIGLFAKADDASEPQWIWSSADRASPDSATLSKSFALAKLPRQATLRGLAAFADVAVYLNGQSVGLIDAYGQRTDVDVTRWCKAGENELKLIGTKLSGPSAVAVELETMLEDGSRQSLVSDGGWSVSTKDEQPIGLASSFGGLGNLSWAGRADELKIEAFEEYNQWKEAQTTPGVENVGKFFVRPGFQLEVVRTARPEEGSWVSMAFDPQGRIVIAREKRGLLRFALGSDPAAPAEVIDDTLEECRGLLYAFGSLYANANNSRALYRLRDADGDDTFEDVKLLARMEGDVGHGRNDLVLGPDQKIYLACGDDVLPPAGARFLTPPEQLPAHRNEGFVVRTDADGATWEVVSVGLRNPFGLAFNADGELFTFDADMELDLGVPYYRPTGVFQIASGCDYGWRRNPHPTPQYLPDTLPHTLTIGKSSPTSIAFGTESRFPEVYRRALFLLDWSYGRIIAVHMLPRGAGYVCRGEVFLRGRPLNVTDLAFGPDGAMYFTTGGRGTQSALYRVRADNAKPPHPDPLSRGGGEGDDSLQEVVLTQHAAAARVLKRQFEAFHGKQDSSAIGVAWPQLANPDPLISHAARVAIEHQPVAQWKDLALSEQGVDTQLLALLALARVGPVDCVSPIVSQLLELKTHEFTEHNKLTVARIYEVCCSRQPLPESLAAAALTQLEPLVPCDSMALNREIGHLLVVLDSPRAVEKLLTLASLSATQEESLHYLFALRDARRGWSEATQRDYFSRLRDAEESEKHSAHLFGFVRRIKSDAMAKLSDAQRAALADLLVPSASEGIVEVHPTQRPLVQNWKLSDFARATENLVQAGKPELGRELFVAANCARCHRYGEIGRGFGPDLSQVASRFSPRDILGAILEPSQAVDEKYRTVAITTTDGLIITGQLITDDYRESLLRIATNPLNPAETVTVPKGGIDSFKKTELSIMPTGLLDTFTREEIASLIGYLTSPLRYETKQ